MTPQNSQSSFLVQCRKRAIGAPVKQEVSSFLTIGGKLETFTLKQATQAETESRPKQPETLIGREVSKETSKETLWKLTPETLETFGGKKGPESFHVSNPETGASIAALTGKKITRDDIPYVGYQLARLPDRLRAKALDHYLVVYAQAFEQCSNQNGRENAGRRAANTWLRTEAQTWK